MRTESSPSTPPYGRSSAFTPPDGDLQSIRVLVYTDDPLKVNFTNTDPFGIGLMVKFLSARQPAFATVTVDIRFRNLGPDEAGHAKRRLTGPVLGEYDQVWFFGLHMANLSQFNWPENFGHRGGPFSELTDAEVASLTTWMGAAENAGGVLVTGDHSQDKPPGAADPGLPPTLSLGRALGCKVPRARQMRTWEGGPTNDKKNSFNTQVPDGKNDPNDSALGGDSVPQRLTLPRQGGGRPHNLFLDRDGSEIDVYPDHAHEGEVIIPSGRGGEWPPGGPEPIPVAYGTDKTKRGTYTMVAVYDGDTAAVGRIVSDSTWHHYFNFNLQGFDADPVARSTAERLGQFYSNLAVWLSPIRKRRAMARTMFRWLAGHPLVAEEAGNGADRVGAVARHVLAGIAGHSEVRELLLSYTPTELRARRRNISYLEAPDALNPLPSVEAILGSVVTRYYRDSPTAPRRMPEGGDAGLPESRSINAGFSDAFGLHAESLAELATVARENYVEVRLRTQRGRRDGGSAGEAGG